MTFRDALDAVLSALELDADPATVLAEHGFADLPPETLSSALLHFAERAPLDVADALAPIITRVSPVPFELGDLPPSPADDVLAEGGDVFRLLREVGLADPDPDEADPTGFDAEDFGADAFEPDDSGTGGFDPEDSGSDSMAGTVAETSGETNDDAGHTFGEGHETGSDDPFDPGAFGHEDFDPGETFGDHDFSPTGGTDDDGPDRGALSGPDGAEPTDEGLESLGDLDTFDTQIDQIDHQQDPADLDLD